MTSPTNEQPCPLAEQAIGWALHALEPDEEMAVVRHIPQCRRCQSAVRDAEEVLANLGVSVEQVDPPASLRRGLLAAAADTPQRTPLPRISPESAASGRQDGRSRHRAPEQPAPVRPPARLPEPRMSRGSFLSARGRRLVAASIALVGIVTVGGLAARTAVLQQQRDAESTQAQSIADLIPQLDRPGVKHAMLADVTDNSTVAAVLVADGERQVFTIGLPSNQADRNTYVLWGVRTGEAPQPLGTFDVESADRGQRVVGSATEADDYSAYAISIEPGRVAPAVPTTVVAQGAVAA